MSSSTTHPLADAWLRDLELLLHGIDPGERAEVLAGVREHLDGSLRPGASDDDVRRVLADLGSPQSVADEAYAGRPPTTSTPPRPAQPPVMARAWVPVVVGILLGLALLLVTFVVSGSSGYSSSSSSMSAATQVDPATGAVTDVPGSTPTTTEGPIQYDANPLGGVIEALAVSWLLWIPATALVLLSPLWTTRAKRALCVLTPGAAILMSGLPAIGWALTRKEIGINVGAWVGLVLVVGGGGWLLVRLCRSAALRATRAAA